MSTITPNQLKAIQTVLHKNFKNREDRITYINEILNIEIKSTKELTFIQAEDFIYFLKYGSYKIQNYALFNSKNTQHLRILSICKSLGWVTFYKGKSFADLNRLDRWLKSKRCPVKKTLLLMTSKECSKIITALENQV